MINLTSIRTPLQVHGIRDKANLPFAQAVDWEDFWRCRRAGMVANVAALSKRCAPREPGEYMIVPETLGLTKYEARIEAVRPSRHGYTEFHNPEKAWQRQLDDEVRAKLGLPKKPVDRSDDLK